MTDPNQEYPTAKVCGSCKALKPITEFGRNKKCEDGIHYYCKSCVASKARSYYHQNRDECIKKNREWKKNNPHKIAEYEANRTAEDPDWRNRGKRERWRQNREKNIQRLRDRYAKNRVKLIASVREWQKRNPEIVAANESRRRAREMNAPVNDLTASQWEYILKAFKYRCAYCGARQGRGRWTLTQDHVVPLSKGGCHTVSNVVPACMSCNCRKGNRAPLRPVQPLLLTAAE